MLDKTQRPDKPEKLHCRECKQEFPFTPEFFYRDRKRKYGLDTVCKFCSRLGTRRRYAENPELWHQSNRKYRQTHLEETNNKKRKWAKRNPDKERNARLKYTYGITLDEFNHILMLQENCCAICGYSFGGKKPSVDHDHTTGVVRGLLCDRCNFGIGCFEDDAARLEKAAIYLNKWKESIKKVVGVESPNEIGLDI